MAKTEKVTVTLPVEQVAAIRRLVENGAAASISGYVQGAVAEALENRAVLLQMLAEDFAASGGPPTEDEVAWADAVLGADGPPRNPGPYPYPESREAS